MKFVKLQRTAIVGGVPRSPAESPPLVSNRQAAHMVEMGDVLKEDVTDAPDAPDEHDHVAAASGEGAKGNKKALADALKKQTAEHDAIFEQKVADEVEKRLADRNQEDFDKAVTAEVEKLTAPSS